VLTVKAIKEDFISELNLVAKTSNLKSFKDILNNCSTFLSASEDIQNNLPNPNSELIKKI